ncbi:MAG TPA: hypothetical protein VFG59_06685 [Anaeromyxobacter sp.]|nr:hypothetical protein [Anaeromyxobacter sp.]
MRTRALSALAFLALWACSPKFDGPEKVKGLRILAVSSEPPEIGAASDGSGSPWPADHATIRSLVGHPQFALDGSTQAVVLHLSCTPAPGEVAASPCTSVSELSAPSDLLELLDPASACNSPGTGAVDAITFSGLEACSRLGCAPFSVLRDPGDPSSAVELPAPAYALPADFSLAALPAGNTQRLLGVDVVDLGLAVQAAPEDLAPPSPAADGCATLGAVLSRFEEAWPARPHLASLKWIHVRGPDMPAASPPNHNPTLSGITFDGAPLPLPGATPLPVSAGTRRDLLPKLPADFSTLREQYQRFDTDGKLIDTRLEDWAYSWFATNGDLENPHTQSWDEANPYTPANGPAVLWLVVRDLRGGEAFTAGEVEAPPAP